MLYILLFYRIFTQFRTILLTFFLLQIPGMVILLGICMFYDIGQFPEIFRWFDSADPYIGRDSSVIQGVNTQGYLAKYLWTAFRNPINYFSYIHLGFTWDNPVKLNELGDSLVGDSSNHHEGLHYLEIKQNNKTYYEYYYIKKWSLNTCLRFRLGWKIVDLTSNKNGDIQQHVLVFQPYKSYTGI